MDRFTLGKEVVSPGERKLVELSVVNVTSSLPVTLPVGVVQRKKEGPCILVTGCLHGDELNGSEIVRCR